MAMIIPVSPDAALAALDKALPRFAVHASAPVPDAASMTAKAAIDDLAFRPHISVRPSIALQAPGIGKGVVDFLSRRRGLAAAAVGTKTLATAVNTAVNTAANTAPPISALVGDSPHRPLAAQVHVMGLTDLAARKSPRNVPATLWTHFLSEGSDGAHAVADVDARSFAFTSISEGPAVQEVSRRIAGLVASEASSAKASELAMIRVPALHLSALWLKAAGGEADDVVIPNEGPIAPLVPGRRYALAEFQEIVAQMAEDRLRMERGDSGG